MPISHLFKLADLLATNLEHPPEPVGADFRHYRGRTHETLLRRAVVRFGRRPVSTTVPYLYHFRVLSYTSFSSESSPRYFIPAFDIAVANKAALIGLWVGRELATQFICCPAPRRHGATIELSYTWGTMALQTY